MKKTMMTVMAALSLMAPVAAGAVAGGCSTTAQPVAAATGAINKMIEANGYKPAKITTYKTTFTEGDKFRNGKPEGVVIHDTANDQSTIFNEITFMQRAWSNTTYSYVHAFVDANNIINIHPTSETVWGAGPKANARFIQIELVHSHSTADFAKSVNNDAYYTAYLLKQYGLPVDDASDGSGTVWTHHQVSTHLGGTDHVDPDGYFGRYGYNFSQFMELVRKHYTNLGNSVPLAPSALDKPVTTTSVNKTMVVNGNGVNGLYYLTKNGFEYSGKMSKTVNGRKFVVTKEATSERGNHFSLLTENGNAVAWVSTGILAMAPQEAPVQQTAHLTVDVKYGQPLYYLLNTGFSQFNTTSYFSQTRYQVTRQATVGNQRYYLLSKDGTNGFAWIAAEGINITNNDNTMDPNFRGVVKVNYVPGYGIAIWDQPYGNAIPNRYLTHGTAWQVFAKQTVNGHLWYNLGGNQWLDSTYAQLQ